MILISLIEVIELKPEDNRVVMRAAFLAAVLGPEAEADRSRLSAASFFEEELVIALAKIAKSDNDKK